jgi:uncharacterized repeat protein (TIGR03803 family)
MNTISEGNRISYKGCATSLASRLRRDIGLVCLVLAAALVLPAQNQNAVQFKTLFNFDGTNGANPLGPLVWGPDGHLYGTTYSGGTSATSAPCAPYGCGTVFKITPSGKLTTIYNFCSQPNCADGSGPVAALVLGIDGNLYGVTELGGTGVAFCPYPSRIGCGTAFKITPGGKLTTIYNWCSQPNCADGTFLNFTQSQGSFVQAADGNFYGRPSSEGRPTAEQCSNSAQAGSLRRSTLFVPRAVAQTEAHLGV